MKEKRMKAASFALLGLALLFLIFLNIFYHDQWLDSDMAAEMIFSRLLAGSGHLFGTADWYYSTEFRFLYTQLVMTPLFWISDNWHLIRMITNIVAYVLMLASYFYLMNPLKVKVYWTALTGTILLLPFSETMMTHMQMGNTYMPHVIILFFFLGMFLRLVKKDGCSRKRKLEITVFYVLLAVICGVSGVRYLLAMQCPLVLTAFFYLAGSEEFQSLRSRFGVERNLKDCWRRIGKSERAYYLYYSLLGAAAGILGYCINVLWVSRKYVFQTYGATNFIAVYQGVFLERLQNAFGCLLMLFGYIPDRGFLSLRGLITLSAFVMIAIFIYCGVKSFQKSSGQRFFVVAFLAAALALNVFVFVFTDSTMVPRYYITIFIFALPVLALYFESGEPALDKLALGLILALCLCMGTAKVTLSYLTVDKNENKRGVAAFLAENDYAFGYATYWNANIITELTNGEVEVGNILSLENFAFFKWSSPMKYYEDGYYQGEVFLLLTAGEAVQYENTEAVQAGRKIYEDGHYVVFVYDSMADLTACAQDN